ncbi:MAG: efflux RND transporter permease subunit [Deltaproteobacteria bacterium]|nr:efflux RND transporter permease subunit [Deltaproteobacteria bacterium]
MNFIELCLKRPVTVMVGVILVIMFGLLGLTSLPIQLTPDVSLPELTIKTIWPGAAAYEIEREIIEPQEDVLKGLRQLVKMESESVNNTGRIILTFSLDANLEDVMLRTSNKLNEVSKYPENAEQPIITASGANASPVIWVMFKTLPENKRDIFTYRTYFDDHVSQLLERVPGVAEIYIGGGTEDEIQVITNPYALAAKGISISHLSDRLRDENVNISGGDISTGKRKYLVRTLGEYQSPEDISKVIVSSEADRVITVGDIAEVKAGYKKATSTIFHNGQTALAIGIKKEAGTNVLEMTRRAHLVVDQLNAGMLKKNGLFLDWVYDQTPYIDSAIGLVKQNIWIGGALAIIILLLFLRSLSATLVVAAAIPISVIGTFLFLLLGHRNLNVISLAGMSFAVGMVVDNAIVVMENIDRHRKMGKTPFLASRDGCQEVWGAVLASTVTTLAVFIPIIFIKEEAGQLFKDLAIAICGSIALSLVVSVTFIPVFSNILSRLREKNRARKRKTKAPKSVPAPDPLTRLGNSLTRYITSLVVWFTERWYRRLTVVLLLGVGALVVAGLLFPKMEYLPTGNRNLILSILVPPPGYSDAEIKAVGNEIGRQLKPYMEKAIGDADQVKTYFYIGRGQMLFVGAKSIRPERVRSIIAPLQKIVASIPGMYGITMQRGIFAKGLGKGRTIEVDINGPDLNRLTAAGGTLFGMIRKALPGTQIRPVPSLELTNPEVTITPRRERSAALGIDAKELGLMVDVFLDGRKIDDFKAPGHNQIDLTLMGEKDFISTPDQIINLPMVTGDGHVIPLSSVANFTETSGPTQINHLERRRNITLQVTPPKSMPLEEAMDILEQKLLPQLEKMGLSGNGVEISLSGTADKLTQTRHALQKNFVLALIITYLLMAALFESFFYPLIIMISVPPAAAGGFIGLALVNKFIAPQALDILTMLGFIILIGVVVNNAILIVHQTLNFKNSGMLAKEALKASVESRIRPIFMSSLTSVLGMLPLVLFRGAGSELYRGLGSVVLGGLALSTIFTIFMVPALLSFFIKD